MTATVITNPLSEPSGLGSLDALASALAPTGDAPAPARERAAAPSEPAVDATTTAPERAPATPGTDAPPASTAEPTESAEPAAPAVRRTHPKGWQGTEEEWQAFRAESNRKANEERDRANKEAAQRQALEDRMAFLEAQLQTRDSEFQHFLEQGYQDPERAAQILNASRQQGTDAYLMTKQEREAQEAAHAATAQDRETITSAVVAAAKAHAKEVFNDHLSEIIAYAGEQGVAGLNLKAALEDQLLSDDLGALTALSNEYHYEDPRAIDLTERIYKMAIPKVRAEIDAAAQAKAATQQPKPGSDAARQTAGGGSTSGGGQPWQAPTYESITSNLDGYYKKVGWGKVSPPGT